MGPKYTQISLQERCQIASLQSRRFSIRQIAATLDRAPSTIARELRRNQTARGQYEPAYADQQGRARRWTGSMLDRDPVLRAKVLALLSAGLSPEQVAGRLALEVGIHVISYETIYRFIYAQIARTKDYSWRRLLPMKKYRRRRRHLKASSSTSFIPLRQPISERPPEVNDRGTPGHWEADLMLFRIRQQAILTLCERRSCLLIAKRIDGKAAEPVAKAIITILGQLPPAWRQTVTFDNGTEFALHYQLHSLGIETYFCNTYAPWQKGGVENAIGRMRRRLPRKTDLATISDQQFLALIQAYNNTPRKCLDFHTPAEYFWSELLHFKRESIFPPSRE